MWIEVAGVAKPAHCYPHHAICSIVLKLAVHGHYHFPNKLCTSSMVMLIVSSAPFGSNFRCQAMHKLSLDLWVRAESRSLFWKAKFPSTNATGDVLSFGVSFNACVSILHESMILICTS